MFAFIGTFILFAFGSLVLQLLGYVINAKLDAKLEEQAKARELAKEAQNVQK